MEDEEKYMKGRQRNKWSKKARRERKRGQKLLKKAMRKLYKKGDEKRV